MERSHIGFFVLFFSFPLFGFTAINPAGTKDGSETWGYVQVRQGAHMFWWYFKSPNRIENPNKPWPIILWLQGGPGSSGVGFGNFGEIGPLDEYLKPRNSTWLQKADLLFVEAPVGTGYSYVEDSKLLSKTDEEAATDLTSLLISFFKCNVKLRKSPLYIVAESYGGKFAVTLGLSALKAIENRRLKATLGGIALGNSWISPEDYVSSWGPLLKDVSRLDNNGLRESNIIVNRIKKQLKDGKFGSAYDSWDELQRVILSYSDGVDFYNFLMNSWTDPLASTAATQVSQQTISVKQYSTYLASVMSRPSSSKGQDGNLTRLMNEEIRDKLKIIPKNVTWEAMSGPVFDAFRGDFMKARINEVDQLLSRGVNVTIYNGQLDVICCTKGTEAWVQKLKWNGIETFMRMNRTPIYYCGGKSEPTMGFGKYYKNLHLYWILNSGHFVPAEQPCVTLNMIASITNSPT